MKEVIFNRPINATRAGEPNLSRFKGLDVPIEKQFFKKKITFTTNGC
jgi:hypothetical protein